LQRGSVTVRVPPIVFVACLVPAIASSQSLGDASRAAAGKRRTGTATRYTNEDLFSRHRAEDEGARAESSQEETTVAPTGTTAKPGQRRGSASSSPRPASTDPVREMLDREEAQRQARESSWRRSALWSVERVRRAEVEYRAACGQQAAPGG
jgi:hypothetical protein